MPAQTVAEALQQAQLYSDDRRYRFLQLPVNGLIAAAGIMAESGEPFAALLYDKDEITLMIDEEDYETFGKRLPDHQTSATVYRLITLDVELDPMLIGLMARISQTLADANISLLPFAAYSRDHLFVAEADFERAMQALQTLKDNA